MKTDMYELNLLVDAIESRLVKEKRKRGSCDKLFILPRLDVPKDFREGW